MTTDRCESLSPIYKFDEGPRLCRGEKNHKGDHYAKTSDGRYVDPQYDYGVTWKDKNDD
jgi:hypothetical protein